MKYFKIENNRHRFALAFIFTLCVNFLLFAVGELYFCFCKNDLIEPKKTNSIVQVTLGKSIRENIFAQQTVHQTNQNNFDRETKQESISNQFSDDILFPSQTITDEAPGSIINESKNINVTKNNFTNIDSHKNVFLEPTNILETTIGDNIISSPEISSAESERNKLAEMIYSLIEKEKQYPPLARRRNIEGQVDVAIIVSTNGALEANNIFLSSGNSILDQAAINLVKNIFPLNIILQSETSITVTIHYSLK